MKFSAAVLSALCLVGTVEGNASVATPQEKVLELLKKLTDDVVKEGEVETKQFAEYAEFCEKTIDEKKYQIDKASKKIENLAALVKSFSEDADTLNGEVVVLNETIDELQKKTTDLNAARDGEVATYMGQAKEMDTSISSLSRAIETLTASAKNLDGKVGLAQLSSHASKVLESVGKINQLKVNGEQLNALYDLVDQPGQAASYTYKAGDIVAMLKGLLTTFTANKAALDMTESKNKGSYQQKKLNLKQQMDITKKEQAEKTLTEADKNNKATTHDRTKTETTNARDADAGFLEALEADCKTKADISKQRAETREGELKALAEASQALEEGGVSFVQKDSHVEPRALRPISKVSDLASFGAPETVTVVEPASFMQLRGSLARSQLQSKVITKLSNILEESAARMNSPVLALAATRVKAGGNDNFVEVRAVISDLIKRMKESGSKEADTKAFCDKEVKKHTTDRDNSKAFIETKTAFIDSTNATANKLMAEIAVLEKDIARTEAELADATDMRDKEREENEQIIKDSEAGESGTEMALSILKKFYEANAFIQGPNKNGKRIYSGEAVDASGKSVADVAPTVTAEEYKGGQEKSKGLLAMLDVLHSDFARTLARTKAAEEKAQSDFDTMKDDATKELDSMDQEVADKTADLTKAKEDLVKAEDEKKVRSEELQMTMDELSKLKGMCAEGDESYEARRAKRQQEIETLEESIVLINDLIKEMEEAR
eukprot:TRINITY_DN1301_c0_g1_i2.p1 TRINITY_DN1301_c0_g1~~TRINITY_DN1301_c0_g1_i2.p1  ORF type:complete len:723 (+),score=260.49 TRINITY_DN1301_c0_g1_i2:170-2338(+)